MERDFLGIGGNDSGDLVSGDGMGDRLEQAVEWPLLKKTSVLQQFMSFNTTQQKSKTALFDQNSLQPIATAFSFVSESLPQKSFGSERHGMQKFFNPAVPNQVHPFFTVHDSSSGPNLTVTTVKHQPFGHGFTSNNPWVVSPPRRVMKAPTTTAQLTIFYAGSVSVYDDVPLDKAQAVMVMASDQAYKKTENPKAETNMVGKNNEGPIQANQNDSSTASSFLPRAVPQARKASLSRFLEKRKERVSTTGMPYSSAKAPPANTMRPAQGSLGSSQDCSWFIGERKKTEVEDDSPNTKLEM